MRLSSSKTKKPTPHFISPIPPKAKPAKKKPAEKSSSKKKKAEQIEQKKPEFVIGLDINSQSTGYTVLDATGAALECGVIDTSDGKNIYEKATTIKGKLEELYSKYKPESEWLVGVEDFLKGFGGRFRTKDLFTLAQINSLVSYDCIKIFNTLPSRVHPSSARHHFGLKKRRNVRHKEDCI